MSNHACNTQPAGSQPRATVYRTITATAAIHIPEEETEARLAALKADLPPRTARRMSRLGLMLSHLMTQTGVDAETTILYASEFGEGRTLETYLASFPEPSPLGFQSSIHPGGVEQALILRQQPIREFFPVTASDNLPLALFRTQALCPHSQRILLLGGEESATWLAEHRLAANANFAFALLLETPQAGHSRLGSLSLCEPDSATEQTAPTSLPTNAIRQTNDTTQTKGFSRSGETLYDLCIAIEQRLPMRFQHPDEGCWQLNWQ